jgi:hypothetical protein
VNEETLAFLAKWQILSIFVVLALTACVPTAQIIVPTDPPTATASLSPSPSGTGGALLATFTAIPVIRDPNAPTPTSLIGATRTPLPADFPTPTRVFDPNSPRIDFFTSDPITVAPGGSVTLYWSSRNVDHVVIYVIDEDGVRSQVYNELPDGDRTINVPSSERGDLHFVIAVGDGGEYIEQELVIALECPDLWFFEPIPADCALSAAQPSQIYDITMERGRMLYVVETNTVYALFNDGRPNSPAWLSFENRFNPEIHPSIEENAPIEWIQPRDELGLVWRSNDDVRSRLGLGLADAILFEGYVQEGSAGSGRETLYISGANGVVLQLLPNGEIWQIIGGPR